MAVIAYWLVLHLGCPVIGILCSGDEACLIDQFLAAVEARQRVLACSWTGQACLPDVPVAFGESPAGFGEPAAQFCSVVLQAFRAGLPDSAWEFPLREFHDESAAFGDLDAWECNLVVPVFHEVDVGGHWSLPSLGARQRSPLSSRLYCLIPWAWVDGSRPWRVTSA